ncbi:unnamed protein product [Schistosoma turkestanicum]|nr:unnamed protein product [Schistosoma turkestanicum]
MSSPVPNSQEARLVSTPSFFLGIVKQVLSGDTILIRDRPIDGPPPERTIVLSNISCGRVARKPTTGIPTGTPEDPFAWEAREFVRTLLVGKEVCYSVESEQPSGRKYGSVYIGKNTNGENVALSLVEQGLAEVRKLSPAVAAKSKVYQQLVAAQEQAKLLGKGRWSSDSFVTREIIWSVENARGFFEQYKNQPLKAVVENVRDGCSVQVFILPESLSEKPNTFVYLTVTMSGIKSPSIRYEDGKIVSDSWGLDALFFTESRLLQRDVTVLLESVFNQNFIGSILHPNGNIAELLLRNGLAHCIDWNLNLVSVPGAAEAYKAAERFAKEKRLRLFENYQPTETKEVHAGSHSTIVPGKIFSGIIYEVGNGDNISVKCSDGIHKFFLSSIRAPRPQNTGKEEDSTAQRGRIRPLYDIPYVFEAREVLRQFVGKQVTVQVDYIQPKTANTVDERVCATVRADDVNLALALVSRGLASVIRYRNTNDSRTVFYSELLAAEENAQAKGLGMYSKQDPPIHRVADLTGNTSEKLSLFVMCTLSRKKLHHQLENVKAFQNPKLELEQYCTSAHVAADILFNIQMADNALQDMSVADLGCGTGILSIGAKLLGASCVLGFEIDEDAVNEFQSNLEACGMSDENINVTLCDVVRLFRESNKKVVDTVILNPPFGTNPKNNGIDMAFLRVALSIAHSHVYSLHKTSTRKHVLRTIQSTGAQSKVVAELRYDLPRSYKRHRYDTVDIAVDLVHSWF